MFWIWGHFTNWLSFITVPCCKHFFGLWRRVVSTTYVNTFVACSCAFFYDHLCNLSVLWPVTSAANIFPTAKRCSSWCLPECCFHSLQRLVIHEQQEFQLLALTNQHHPIPVPQKPSDLLIPRAAIEVQCHAFLVHGLVPSIQSSCLWPKKFLQFLLATW